MIELLAANPLLSIMLVLALGAAFGTIPFGPIKLGAAGALFVGLAIGALDPRLGEGLGLVQTLGLALFVYTVGISAGATFFGSLKRQAPLLGVGVVALSLAALVAVVVGKITGLSMGLLDGSYAGALTSTPALAAATAATGSSDAAVGYSIGYPVGVVFSIVIVAWVVTRTWPGTKDTPSLSSAGIEAITAVVERGTPIRDVPGWAEQQVKMSYLRRRGTTRVIVPGEVLEVDDEVLVVGTCEAVKEAIEFLGHKADVNLTNHRADVDFKRFVVSNPEIFSRTVAELNIPGKLGGVITRVRRGDLDLLADDDLVLQPSDRVLAVVPSAELDAAMELFGDSERRVSEIDALSLAVGMTLGLLLGMVAIPLPGGAVFSFGSAAGPLIVGMILGALHRTGPLIWDMPQAANLTIRQLGLLLFLAAVGLANGQAFISQAFTSTGLMAGVVSVAVVVTAAAAFIVGGRLLGISAQRTAGGFAGLVGQPAVLAYATGRVTDERIEAGYASLFAVSIIVKILAVQVIPLL